MPLPGLFLDDRPPLADHSSLSAVVLVWRHEFDAAVAVPVVVPVDERRHPQAGFLRAGKGPARVVRPVFRRPEQGFRVRGVVRHPGS